MTNSLIEGNTSAEKIITCLKIDNPCQLFGKLQIASSLPHELYEGSDERKNVICFYFKYHDGSQLMIHSNGKIELLTEKEH